MSEVLVISDFSENYSFVIQDEAQSYHQNNDQATTRTFIIYFKTENKVQPHSFVTISKYLEYNTAAINLFQQKFIDYSKLKLDNIVKKKKKNVFLCCLTGVQYKNKNLNLRYHKKDFMVKVEWQLLSDFSYRSQ